MIILPDRHTPRAKLLMPVHQSVWREKSQSLQKDDMSNFDCTLFKITATSRTGAVLWRGWYQDRADADAVLHAILMGKIRHERSLWRLSDVEWNSDIPSDALYQINTCLFLSCHAGEVQQMSVPMDWSVPLQAPGYVSESEYLFWSGSPNFFTSGTSDTAPGNFNSSSNKIEVIGGGGSGGRSYRTDNIDVGGGGGGAYSSVSNLSISGGATVYYSIGTGQPRVTTNTTGSAGGDTWFNRSTNSAPTLSSNGALAKGGDGGFRSTSPSGGSAGGSAASGVGATKYSGGSSGFTDSAQTASGGGGAAGMNGNGNSSANPVGGNSATAGGSGDAGFGGAGGSPINGNNPGGNGTEWSALYGSGGGGAGWGTGNDTGATAGSGGNYGGGGGAACQYNNTTANSGAGIQGLLVVTYTPALANFNMPMLGM
jgi:hypothetical protein